MYVLTLFKIQFLYLGARLQTFLYLLVIRSPLFDIIDQSAVTLYRDGKRRVADALTVPQTQHVYFLPS